MIGRITADPEVKYTSEGQAVATFSLAIDRPISQEKKNELESEGKQTADFPRVVVWGKRAETVGKYMKKGNPIGVSGSVRTGSYTKDDGSKVYTTEILASGVKFITYPTKTTEGVEPNMNAEIENVPF